MVGIDKSTELWLPQTSDHRYNKIIVKLSVKTWAELRCPFWIVSVPNIKIVFKEIESLNFTKEIIKKFILGKIAFPLKSDFTKWEA